jgi:hypothetical protein
MEGNATFNPISEPGDDPTSNIALCSEIVNELITIACCSDDGLELPPSSADSLPDVCRGRLSSATASQDDQIKAVRLEMDDEGPSDADYRSKVVERDDGETIQVTREVSLVATCDSNSLSKNNTRDSPAKAAAEDVPADFSPQADVDEHARPISQASGNQCCHKEEREFEPLWNRRKAEVEKSAETKAAALFRQWKRDRTSLESAIDASLKEYGEMYEKAHALRLLFEEEKRQWAAQVQQMSKRQCVRAADPWPSWPPAGQQQDQRERVERRPFPEFEYTADDDLDESAGRSSPGVRQNCAATVTPQRALKKFTVPLKHGAGDP